MSTFRLTPLQSMICTNKAVGGVCTKSPKESWSHHSGISMQTSMLKNSHQEAVYQCSVQCVRLPKTPNSETPELRKSEESNVGCRWCCVQVAPICLHRIHTILVYAMSGLRRSSCAFTPLTALSIFP